MQTFEDRAFQEYETVCAKALRLSKLGIVEKQTEGWKWLEQTEMWKVENYEIRGVSRGPDHRKSSDFILWQYIIVWFLMDSKHDPWTSCIIISGNSLEISILEPQGFPGGSDGKESACNVRTLDSIPESERSPGEGNGNLLQYSCLKNSIDRRAWGYSPWGHKERDMTEVWHFHYRRFWTVNFWIFVTGWS